jgi:hypothetical protein
VTEHRDRDDVIDRWLRRAASAPAGPGPNAACLDAEVVAAWADGGLPAEALTHVRAHVADCARCQVLAAVMSKLEPADAADGRRPIRASNRQSGSARWLGWFVPLAAAAAAIAIWVFIPRQPAVFPDAPAPQATIAQAPARAPGRDEAPPPAPASRAMDEDIKLRRVDPAPGKREAGQQLGRQENRANEKDARDRAAFAEPKKADAKAAAVPAPAPGVLPPPPPAPVQAPPPPSGAMAQTIPDRGTGQGRGGAGGGARAQRAALAAAESSLSKEIVSTDDAIRWRLSAGIVEKTTDAGRTWTRIDTGVSAELTAGASPSPTTCWLVGRGGIVLLTTDGTTWRRLDFPETTDLSAVRATDARSAVVTTASGREYETSNGGATWLRRDLQEN